MAFENLCMYCFEENGGADVCPHCGRDARAAVPQIQLLPGTLVYNERFLIGRALGQDASGIVYAALDTRRNVKIRIREYLPRDCARRLNSGEVVPEPGMEDQFEAGMRKLRASVEGVEDPAKRHFFFEENGTGYIAQRKNAGAADAGDDDGEHQGRRTALVIGVAAALVLAVAIGVIALVNYFTNSTDTRTEAPKTSGLDIWQPPESPTPTPYASATFAAITDPTHSWMDFTNPDLSGGASDYATPTPAPTPTGGMDTSTTISSKSSPETIKKLQSLLVNLGWLDSSGVTGKYDDATRQAVKDFQQYMNDTYGIDPKLSVDGVAGSKTLTWLLKTDVSMKPTPTPAPVTPSPTQQGKVINENSSAEEIKYVQLQLARLGILSMDDVNGKYDEKTAKAVLAFQQRVNDILQYDALDEDGICGDRTLAYLDYYVDWWEKNQPTPAPTATPAATVTAAPSPAATPEPDEASGEVIDENSSAASIRRVQEMLITLGYLEGSADGAYGQKTYAAVSAFQTDLKSRVDSKVEVTGKCDILTREYLEYYSAQAESQPTATPAVTALELTVSGAQAYEGGVYIVGADGVKISWTSGAQSYSVELTAPDGKLVNKETSTPYTSITLTADGLSSAEAYRFTVTADDTGASAYVSLRAAGEAQPTPTVPSAPVPAITVTGSLSYSDGVYNIGADGVGMSWSAEGTDTFSIYLSKSNGDIVFSDQNTTLTEYRLEAADMEPGEKYSFSVVAIPQGGVETDGQYSSVRLMLNAEATPEPAVTPSANIAAPVITVTGALGEIDGVHYAGEDTMTISWAAEGDVRAYSMYLTNSKGDTLTALTETDQQSMTVNPATMTAGELYTIRIVAIPEGGTEEHGPSAQVQLALYAGQTPAPSEIGQVVINVSGHISSENGVYYAGKDGMVVSWKAEGDVEGYDVLIVASTGETVINKTGVETTSMTVDPADLAEDVAYTCTVTAVPLNGAAADGNSASVVLMRAGAAEIGDVNINVSGHTDVQSGVYCVGSQPVTVEWLSKGAAAYSVYLGKADGTIVNSAENIADTKLELTSEGMEYGEVYTFTVIAMSETGKKDDQKTAAVQFKLAEEARPQVGEPLITVSGHAELRDGVYYAGETELTVEWSAENATMYDVTLYDASGAELHSFEGVTDTRTTVKPDQLSEGGAYTLTVTAIPAGGDRAEGKSASVQLGRKATQVAPGTAAITVEGYTELREGVYYADDSGLSISWSAENAAQYDVAIYNAANEPIKSVEGTTQTQLKVDTTSMKPGEIYTLAVRPVSADGTAGEVAQVKLAHAEIAPTPAPAPGKPVITVSGHEDETDGVYVVGGGNVELTWSAENAALYSVYVYRSDGGVITSVDNSDATGMTVKPGDMPEGDTVTLKVTGVGADGAQGETASVQLRLAAAEATPTPAPRPGLPELSVSGAADYSNGVYYVGPDGMSVTWSAENAAAYNVYVYDANGGTVNSAEGTTETRLNLKADNMPADQVFTLKVTAVGADGSQSDAASISMALYAEENGKWPVTPDSDADTIAEMQKRLYNLGWITEANVSSVQTGVLDAITVQAVYDFQSYVIANQLNPEIGLVNTANPVIDEETLTMLFDTENPVPRPAE